MVFYKFEQHKRGNITVLLSVCIVVCLISLYMINNILQLKVESKVLRDEYQNQLLEFSAYQVCGDKILQLMDNRTVRINDYVFNENDLMEIQSYIESLTGLHREITINSPTGDSLNTIICTVDNVKIEIYNIDKMYNTNAEDANLSTVTVNIDNAKIRMTENYD